jgi:hypothetical protein
VVKSVSLNMALSGSMYNEYKEVALAWLKVLTH